LQNITEAPIPYREDFPCAYFSDGRMCGLEYFFPDLRRAGRYHEYLASGYRRVGSIFYRNVCRGCSSCIPIRLEVSEFVGSRSQGRTARRNSDLSVKVLPFPRVTAQKVALYERYLSTKHGEQGSHNTLHYETVLDGLHHGYPYAIEMEYRLGDSLVGVGVVDEAEDALSSNYFYYETDLLDRRLGVFSVLEEIALAARMGKKYYYLGFYIADNEKMSYKRFFRPNQLYVGTRWRAFMRG